MSAPRTMDAVLCELQACKRQRAALQALVDAADKLSTAEGPILELQAHIASMDAAIAEARRVLRGE